MMPDPAKFAKLDEIGYTVPHCCALCAHVTGTDNDWAHCTLHRYTHEKHTQEGRPLGVSIYGSCRDFTPGPWAAKTLQSYLVFLKP